MVNQLEVCYALPMQTIILDGKQASLELGNPTETISLELTASMDPEAVYQVFVGKQHIGNVSTYGAPETKLGGVKERFLFQVPEPDGLVEFKLAAGQTHHIPMFVQVQFI